MAVRLFKIRFNELFQYLRHCITPRCLRGQVYDQRCYKHYTR